MKVSLTRILGRCAAVCLMASSGWSLASDNSATVFPAEGSKTCSDYASNKVILSMGTTAAIPGGTGTVTGTDNPKDADTTGERATYTLSSDGKSLLFTGSTTPIDYAVVKSSSAIEVVIYPAGGVTSDKNIVLPSASGNLTITAFSLCYGLGNQPSAPPPPSITKSCNTSGVLDGTGIMCPSNGARTLVCNIELDKPFFGMNDGSDVCCVCNEDALTECDPSIPFDAANPDSRACPGPTTGTNQKEVTTTIEINKDPYFCTSAGGTMKCYPY